MISHFAYGISLCYLRFLSYSALCNANETNVASAASFTFARLLAHLVRPETGAKLLTALVVDFPHFARFTPKRQHKRRAAKRVANEEKEIKQKAQRFISL